MRYDTRAMGDTILIYNTRYDINTTDRLYKQL